MKVYYGDNYTFAISSRTPLTPPDVFSFSENFEKTCIVLEKIRRRFLSAGGPRARWMSKRKNEHLQRLPTYWDFAQIKEISPSAALVFSAEYARMATLMGSTPPPVINLEGWSPTVLSALKELGFFDIIGLSNESFSERFQNNEDVLLLKIITGTGEKTEEADRALIRLGDFLNPHEILPESVSIPVLSALSEAMVNAREHAYPTNHAYTYPHVNRWWVTGMADRRDQTLSISIFDQGATIPVTYSKLPRFGEVASFLGNLMGDGHQFRNDGRLLEAANRFGNSQKRGRERGHGLPQMRDAIDAAGNGSLRIWSRGGEYIYEAGRHEHRWHPVSIGGTLIEWTMRLKCETADA